MPFRPTSGDHLVIRNKSYQFTAHPAANGMVYGQAGRRGTVYQLEDSSGEKWALKVFENRFREPRLVGQAERIADYVSMPGLQACERRVLTSRRDIKLIRDHIDLAYAVLMPWIDGRTWTELVIGRESFTPEESLRTARAFVDVLTRLEERGLAHCDLSGPNVILTPSGTFELIDLEEMYGPELIRPKALPGGSPGYAHKSAPEGIWRDEADRFSGSILIAEMLGFAEEEIRSAAWGEGYFDPDEMQTKCDRFQLLANNLENNCGKDVCYLFERTWFADSLLDCPTFTEWMAVLPESIPEIQKSTSAARVRRKERIEPSLSDGIQSVMDEASVELLDEELPTATYEIGRVCEVCGRPLKADVDVCPYCEHSEKPRELPRKTRIEIQRLRPRRQIWPWVPLGLVGAMLGTIASVLVWRWYLGLPSSQSTPEPELAVMQITSTLEKVMEIEPSDTSPPSPTPFPAEWLEDAWASLNAVDAVIQLDQVQTDELQLMGDRVDQYRGYLSNASESYSMNDFITANKFLSLAQEWLAPRHYEWEPGVDVSVFNFYSYNECTYEDEVQEGDKVRDIIGHWRLEYSVPADIPPSSGDFELDVKYRHLDGDVRINFRSSGIEDEWFEYILEPGCNIAGLHRELCLYKTVYEPFYFNSYTGCGFGIPDYGIWSELKVVATMDTIEIYQNGIKRCTYVDDSPILFGYVDIDGTGHVQISKVILDWKPYRPLEY